MLKRAAVDSADGAGCHCRVPRCRAPYVQQWIYSLSFPNFNKLSCRDPLANIFLHSACVSSVYMGLCDRMSEKMNLKLGLDERAQLECGTNMAATNVIATNICSFVPTTNMHWTWKRQWCGSRFVPHNEPFFVSFFNITKPFPVQFGWELVSASFVCSVNTIEVRCAFSWHLQLFTLTNLPHSMFVSAVFVPHSSCARSLKPSFSDRLDGRISVSTWAET